MAKRRQRLDADDLLAAPESASPLDIIRQIHAINPTDRPLPPADRAERYEKKARLQSLLIRRFGKDLEVERRGGDPDVVSLYLRAGRRDAAHARISALEEDARRWVRQQLEALPEPPQPALRALPQTPELNPLQEGQKALAQFDYEAARDCFEAALARPDMAPAAGRALLELLVETLSLDEDALALAKRLPDVVREEPASRARLGLAAARLGRQAEALAYLQGGSSAAAWEVLAQSAIRRGDRAEASKFLGKLRQQDPAHPSIVSLAERVEQLRALEQKPAEETLQRLVEAGEWDRAEPEARALLAQWPHSLLAQQTVRTIAVRRQERQREELLQQVDAAEREGRLIAARDLLRRAAEVGAAVGERIQALEAALQREQEEQRARQVLTRLASDRCAGLLAAAALPNRLLQPLAAADPALRRLVELGSPRGKDEVEALLDLERAEVAFAAGEFARAESLLSVHHAILRRLPAAMQMRREAIEGAQRQRNTLLRAELRRAEALMREAPEGAWALLHRLEPAGCDQALQERFEDLLREMEEQRGRRDARERYEALLAAGDLFGARDLAAQQQARGAEEESAWRERGQEVNQRIRAAWRITVMDGPFARHDLRDHYFSRYKRAPHLWIREGGEELLLADAWDRWLVLHRVRLRDGCILQRVVMEPPVRMGIPLVQAIGHKAWIWGDGRLLVLDLFTWDILAWRDLRGLHLGAKEYGATIVPGSDHAWVWSTLGEGMCLVFDTRTLRVERRFTSTEAVLVVPGVDPPLVLRCLSHGNVQAHTSRGGRGPFAGQACPPAQAAAAHPDGQRLVLLVSPPKQAGAPHAILERLEFEPGREGATQELLKGSIAGMDCALATLPAEKVTYAAFSSGGTLHALARLAADRRGLQETGREVFTVRWGLAQSADGRFAALIGNAREGFLFEPLGAELPKLEPRWQSTLLGLPDFSEPPHAREMDAIHARVDPLRARLESQPDRAAYLAEREEEILSSAESAANHGFALLLLKEYDLAERLLKRAWERYRGDLVLMLGLTWRSGEEGRWDEVLPYLHATLSEALPTSAQIQLYNLIGIANLHLGRFAAAQTAWRRGLACDDRLAMRDQVAYAQELGSPGSVKEPSGRFVFLVRAIRAADAALAAGDTEAAWAALDQHEVWGQMELQSAARLAAIALKREPADAEGRYWKLITLARFVTFVEPKWVDKIPNLPLGAEGWPPERVKEVAAAGAEWLEQQGTAAQSKMG